MNQEEIDKLVLEIQQKLPVNTFTFNNKLIWPILRKHISYGLLIKTQTPVVQAPEKPPKKKKETSKFFFYTGNIFALIPNYFRHKIFLRKEIDRIHKLESKFMFIIFPTHQHVDLLEDKKYSRYIDPYYEFIKKYFKAVKIQLQEEKIINHKEFYHGGYIVSAAAYINVQEALRKLKLKKPIDEGNSLKEALNQINFFLKSKEINFSLNFYLLYDFLIKTEYCEGFYNKLFSKRLPEVVFFVCFYESPYSYGLVSACKKFKIKSVDIQHGKGNLNYLSWGKEYTYLPDFLWVWTIERYNQIKASDTPVKAFLGGNMWFYKFLNKEMQSKINNSFLNYINKFDKKILVSLQPGVGLSVFPLIKELVTNSAKEWLWLLRFHPLMRPYEREEIIKEFINLKNIEFNHATTLNLYEIFSLVNYQITGWSTTALEGVYMGVPCILIHKNGKSAFNNEIENGWCIYSEKTEEILNIIKDGFKNKQASNSLEFNNEEVIKRFEHELFPV